MFKDIRSGDKIKITIYDGGICEAIVLNVENDKITIRVDKDTYCSCYPCQRLPESEEIIWTVLEEDAYEIQVLQESEDDTHV